MPEIFEAGYFFSLYLFIFITILNWFYPPGYLNVIGIWCDLTEEETEASRSREEDLLRHVQKFKLWMFRQHQLPQWATKLGDLAAAIPDTHGLMIRQVWSLLPREIRVQVSPDHASWETFCLALSELSPNSEPVVPEHLPVPWHRDITTLNYPHLTGGMPRGLF
ncbi:hypothetical protein R3P38DRAFT_1624993 [Favolaschia claudopus]|uniref:Uncharacterized protein n=1 Tax=Favolaschia claudopus TaxID=2862362 RepID=A0AAW0AFK3_9AGAR